jgi:beta-lactamase superfamily II metal-dependent hydrolase
VDQFFFHSCWRFCRRFRWLLFLFFLYGLCGARSAGAAELALHFFDVGQGDAALIVSPTGKRILIDGGPPEGPNSALGQDALLKDLLKLGVDRLDLMLLSHPHLDHLGGLRRVVEELPVTLYLDAGYPSTSPPYTTLLKTLEKRGVPVKKATSGRSIDIGDGATLRLLSPPSPWLHNTRSDVNANSIIVRLTWRDRAALFPGDAEPETEQWLLQQYHGEPELLKAEVLKVPHHGGKYSSTTPFLAAVQPQWAIISVATVNDYGHPTVEAMGRLQQAGARLLRTDQLGTITLRSQDGRPWQLSTALQHPESAQPSPARPLGPTETTNATPAGEATNAAPSSGFVGSSRSSVFHLPSCSAVQKIVPQNLVRWKTRQEALASGRRPAEDCHP